MDCRLRPASESDRQFLYSLHCSTMREAIEETWGWDEAWQRNDFDKRFTLCAVSIIEVDGRAAGGLWLESRPDSIYINMLQVLPQLQRCGIGTKVLREVIAQGIDRGAAVALSVLEINRDAQRLYERLGFEVTHKESPFVRMRRSATASPGDPAADGSVAP